MIVIYVLIIIVFFCYRKDKQIWNNGICKKSGKKWIRFDCDSQGGRLYKDDEGNYCCINYPIDK